MLDDFDFPKTGKDAAPPKIVLTAPLHTFETLKVTDQLMVQYQRAETIIQNIMYDDDIPSSQKAQVINTTTAILARISAIQTERYTAERLKNIENILYRVLNKLPVEVQNEFLEAYENELGVRPHSAAAGDAAEQPGLGEFGSLDGREDLPGQSSVQFQGP